MDLQIKLQDFVVFIHVYDAIAVSWLHTECCQQQISCAGSCCNYVVASRGRQSPSLP
jgi:hypothetical protein